MHLISNYVNPKYAGILYALPIQFTIAAFFIYLGSDKKTIQDLSMGTAISLIALVFFIIFFYLLTKKYNFYISLAFSYLVFFLVGFILIKYVLK
jgi:uncharacterized membrane protein (GlpM family)